MLFTEVNFIWFYFQFIFFSELFRGEDMRASLYHAENDIHISQCCIQSIQVLAASSSLWRHWVWRIDQWFSQLHFFAYVVNGFEGTLVTVQKLHYCSLVFIAPMTLPRICVPWKEWSVWRFSMPVVFRMMLWQYRLHDWTTWDFGRS